MRNVLSIDVAKNKSMFLLMNSDGQVLIEPLELEHNIINFNKLKNEIENLELDNLTVFMESTSTYHLAVEKFFKDNEFNTHVINGLSGKNNFNSLRKTKTDKQDCYNLAKLFFLGELENNNLSKNDLYYNLKTLNRQYLFLIEQNVAVKNRYKRLLDLTFPEFEKVFKQQKIYENTAINFIKEFPHAYIIKSKRIDALTNNLFKTNERHKNYYYKLANTIKEYANISFPGINVDNSDVDNLKITADIMQKNIIEIEKIKTKMITLAKNSSLFTIINSYYGIGELSATQLLAEIGDITRFNNTKQLIACCGLDPTIVQSGKSVNIHGPISKRGNKYTRKILFNICANMVKLSSKSFPSQPIFVYYQKKKLEGKHYYQRLIACSTKLLRILHTMCVNNSEFEVTK